MFALREKGQMKVPPMRKNKSSEQALCPSLKDKVEVKETLIKSNNLSEHTVCPIQRGEVGMKAPTTNRHNIQEHSVNPSNKDLSNGVIQGQSIDGMRLFFLTLSCFFVMDRAMSRPGMSKIFFVCDDHDYVMCLQA